RRAPTTSSLGALATSRGMPALISCPPRGSGRPSSTRDPPMAVRTRQYLQEMAVGVVEVDTAPAFVVVDVARTVLEGVGPVLERTGPDACEDRIEVFLVDQEGVVLGHDGRAPRVDEVERRAIFELDDQEGTERLRRRQAQDVGEKARRLLLVAAVDDRVVEANAHRLILRRSCGVVFSVMRAGR